MTLPGLATRQSGKRFPLHWRDDAGQFRTYERERESMDKNERMAEEILPLVGGKDNVISVFHCATRLRFELRKVCPQRGSAQEG